MTNVSLAEAYLVKAQKRLKMLDVLLAEAAYSDVVREAQESRYAVPILNREAGISHSGIPDPSSRTADPSYGNASATSSGSASAPGGRTVSATYCLPSSRYVMGVPTAMPGRSADASSLPVFLS